MRHTLFAIGIDMPLASNINFFIGDLVEDMLHRQTVRQSGIALQIGLGRIEPVQAVFDMFLQRGLIANRSANKRPRSLCT